VDALCAAGAPVLAVASPARVAALLPGLATRVTPVAVGVLAVGLRFALRALGDLAAELVRPLLPLPPRSFRPVLPLLA
jgi:hypothetical protein